eukprot:TRINITY_DN15214_c0_g1_i1.p1 TRINITY_DN15214_c0_g1~~TRINITY_DN15214_c0_g1_i1.p1  ORF type:complete len:395 (+),score=114.13 TRINITY_DN15214_c0_g1_i1:35-1219(+)
MSILQVDADDMSSSCESSQLSGRDPERMYSSFTKGRVKCQVKRGLMTEDEARYELNKDMCPEGVVERCAVECALLLDLSHFKLTSMPVKLANVDLSHVTQLDLRQNSISELPDALFQLPAVRQVNLSANRLREIPFDIVRWTELHDLDLSSNLLAALPDEFSFLDTLRHLTMDFNYFTHIPECLGELSDLQTLFMVENSGIEVLPNAAWFAGFRCLQFSLDNSPALSQQWEAVMAARPNVRARVRWNKIWPDSVLPGLYLGSLRTAQNSEVFRNLNITHVVTCGRHMQTQVPEGVNHLCVEVDDTESDDLLSHFEESVNFITEALSQGTVLIHCFAGVSRSATVCVAYLIKQKQMGAEQAIALVKEHRPSINPNPSFRAQLLKYEAQQRHIRSP